MSRMRLEYKCRCVSRLSSWALLHKFFCRKKVHKVFGDVWRVIAGPKVVGEVHRQLMDAENVY